MIRGLSRCPAIGTTPRMAGRVSPLRVSLHRQPCFSGVFHRDMETFRGLVLALPWAPTPTVQPKEPVGRFKEMTFLGTGSANSTLVRNTSCLLFTFDSGFHLVVDCGEGSLKQLSRLSHIDATKIRVFLITHLHLDHCIGLFSFLLHLQSAGVRQSPLIVGPVGIRQMVENVLALQGGFKNITLLFHELQYQKPADLGRLLDLPITVSAIPLVHNIPTFGYILQEFPHPPVFRGSLAMAAGVPTSAMKNLTQKGSVELPNGRTVSLSDCFSPAKAGRKISILQDTAFNPKYAPYCKDSDLLIHECTLSDGRNNFNHSTPEIAAEFSVLSNSRILLLTHFSRVVRTKTLTRQQDHLYDHFLGTSQMHTPIVGSITNSVKNRDFSPQEMKKLENLVEGERSRAAPQQPGKMMKTQEERKFSEELTIPGEELSDEEISIPGEQVEEAVEFSNGGASTQAAAPGPPALKFAAPYVENFIDRAINRCRAVAGKNGEIPRVFAAEDFLTFNLSPLIPTENLQPNYTAIELLKENLFIGKENIRRYEENQTTAGQKRDIEMKKS